jgi:DNA-binding IclR family transcriptional regulator
VVAARPAAQELARTTRSCVAVVVPRGDEARVVDVFDRGPAFGLKTSPGQAVPLEAPFGAVFVAWAGDAAVDTWLDGRSDVPKRDRARYRSALSAVRERGYSVTVADSSHIDFARAMSALAAEPEASDILRRRDELMRAIVHTEYLTAAIDPEATLRVSQMSAPVFDSAGRVATAIMVLGPPYEVTAPEIAALGDQLRRAADRATTHLAGAPPTAAA